MIYENVCWACEEIFITGRKNKKTCSKECSFQWQFEKRKIYMREMRNLAIELGNCPSCFKHKENLKYSICSECREKQRIRYKKNKQKGL